MGRVRSGRSRAGKHAFHEIAAIGAVLVGSCCTKDSVAIDETHAKGDFLGAGDFHVLAAFERCDVLRSVQQAVRGSRVEPGITAAEALEYGFVDKVVEHLDDVRPDGALRKAGL